jgi:hypothetical protein
MKACLILLTLALTLTSFADSSSMGLVRSKKAITCYGADNQSIVLNAARTTLTYKVEGESRGPKKVESVKSNNKAYIQYSSDELSLTLRAKGQGLDTFQYDGGDAEHVDCQ